MSRTCFALFFAATLVWTPCAPIRDVGDLGPVVTDIESHLPAGHPYRDADRITWTHEGTHGINSLLRNRYGCPAFYVLKNRAVLMQEPTTTLAMPWSAVAAKVPPSLRGEVYGLYLIQMQSYWNSQPTYVFDEWVAYTNGAEARQALGIRDRAETVRYMLEFCVYAACVPQAAGSDDPQMRAFYKWQVERAVALYRASGVKSNYLDRLRTEPDAALLREYLRGYCGPQWAQRVLRL